MTDRRAPIGDAELARLLAAAPPPPAAAADLTDRIVARALATPQQSAAAPPRWPRRPRRGWGQVTRRMWASVVLGNLLVVAAAAAVLGGHVDLRRFAAVSVHRLAAIPALLLGRHAPRAAPIQRARVERATAPPRAEEPPLRIPAQPSRVRLIPAQAAPARPALSAPLVHAVRPKLQNRPPALLAHHELRRREPVPPAREAGRRRREAARLARVRAPVRTAEPALTAARTPPASDLAREPPIAREPARAAADEPRPAAMDRAPPYQRRLGDRGFRERPFGAGRPFGGRGGRPGRWRLGRRR